jgi:hypothetical protein
MRRNYAARACSATEFSLHQRGLAVSADLRRTPCPGISGYNQNGFAVSNAAHIGCITFNILYLKRLSSNYFYVGGMYWL